MGPVVGSGVFDDVAGVGVGAAGDDISAAAIAFEAAGVEQILGRSAQ